jgi:hypothetical protein
VQPHQPVAGRLHADQVEVLAPAGPGQRLGHDDTCEQRFQLGGVRLLRQRAVASRPSPPPTALQPLERIPGADND